MNHDTSEALRECGRDSQHATLPHHNTFSVTIFGKANVNVCWFAVCSFNTLKTSTVQNYKQTATSASQGTKSVSIVNISWLMLHREIEAFWCQNHRHA